MMESDKIDSKVPSRSQILIKPKWSWYRQSPHSKVEIKSDSMDILE